MKAKHIIPVIALGMCLTACDLSFIDNLLGGIIGDDTTEVTDSTSSGGQNTGTGSGSGTGTGSSSDSESGSDRFDGVPTEGSKSTGRGYYAATSTLTDNWNYKSFNKTEGCDTVPSTGDVNLLVIPVEVTDYPFVRSGLYSSVSQMKTQFDKIFNGNGAKDTGYWESLASYYAKTSYGKLNLTFEIADIYKTGKTSKGLFNYAKDNDAIAVLDDAVANYKLIHGNTSTRQFDSDNDGFIDGVIMIYSNPDFTSDSYIASFDNDDSMFYWAYCFWDYFNANNASLSSPVPETFFWASTSFLYEASVCSPSTGKVDAHTLTHEFGHMLGLDDYYSYDENRTPAGGLEMMDLNIGDHNSFSKAALGWTHPYIVTDSCEITINPATTSGDSIIVADSWNGTSFDEYLIMDLYTPDGLNKVDAQTAYSSRPKMYTTSGVRMHHVDARVALINSRGSGNYIEPTTSSPSYNSYYAVSASNSKNRDSGPSYGYGYDLIRLIQANKSIANVQSQYNYADNRSLFQKGDTFSMSDYHESFPKSTKLNNGNALGYEIEFVSVSSKSATIRFTKL